MILINKVIINYDHKRIYAIALARFDLIHDEVFSVKKLFGRKKQVLIPINRNYCLVFIPWKHQEKEIALVSMEDVISIDSFSGEDIISVREYVCPFVEEDPYYAEFKISNFVGYKFIFEYKNFIADIREQCYNKPLTILYDNLPEFLQEEYDEER